MSLSDHDTYCESHGRRSPVLVRAEGQTAPVSCCTSSEGAGDKQTSQSFPDTCQRHQQSADPAHPKAGSYKLSPRATCHSHPAINSIMEKKNEAIRTLAVTYLLQEMINSILRSYTTIQRLDHDGNQTLSELYNTTGV